MKDIFESMARLYTEPHELAAIWLNMPVVTSKGRQARITEGDNIRVQDGLIMDVKEDCPATHKIVMCFGTLVSQFKIEVVSLDNNVVSTIVL